MRRKLRAQLSGGVAHRQDIAERRAQCLPTHCNTDEYCKSSESARAIRIHVTCAPNLCQTCSTRKIDRTVYHWSAQDFVSHYAMRHSAAVVTAHAKRCRDKIAKIKSKAVADGLSRARAHPPPPPAGGGA